jgi:hypothetical protein
MIYVASANCQHQAAMTVKTRVVYTIVQRLNLGETGIPIRDNQRIQVVDDFIGLRRARKHQYAAFVREEGLLVVWDDDPSHLVSRIESIEADLLKVVWRLQEEDEIPNEKMGLLTSTTALDEETQPVSQARPIRYYMPVMCACTMCLLVVLFGSRMQSIFQSITVLGQYSSLAFVALTPIMAFFTLVSKLIPKAFIRARLTSLHSSSDSWLSVCSPEFSVLSNTSTRTPRPSPP